MLCDCKFRLIVYFCGHLFGQICNLKNGNIRIFQPKIKYFPVQPEVNYNNKFPRMEIKT